MSTRLLFPVCVLAALFAVTPACSEPSRSAASSGEGSDTARDDIRIVFATHGQSADPFWAIVSNGARAAASDLGIRVEYQAPPRFDMVAMSNLIDAAVASRPSGIVVSIPDGNALGPSIRAASEAGIPVISINSGDDIYRELGVLLHVGQPEYDAGLAAGVRMGGAGVMNALCINHEVGNIALDMRCEGFRDGVARSGGSARTVTVDLGNPDDAQQRVTNALAANPDTDGVLTLGPAAVDPTLAGLEAAGRLGRVQYGTFDLTGSVIDALVDGTMAFAIDQQPYLQGYLPVSAMVTYLETLAVPGGGDVLKTGPGFVTAENADRVRSLTERGIR